MPAEGMEWLRCADILPFEEIERLVRDPGRASASRDVRLTGGEPLARREFPRLVACCGRSTSSEDLSVTTNGYLLERDAEALVAAGIGRVNVSVDSLARDRFHEITRRDALPQVLRGLEGDRRPRAVRPIKVNAVAMREFTEPEVFRFAELARAATSRSASSSSCRSTPTGPGSPTGPDRRGAAEHDPRAAPLEQLPREPHATARIYRFA